RVLVDDEVRREADADGVVMSDDTAHALATEGRRIAEAFGAPQDIEWTIDGERRIWFVQARPITAFLPPKGGSYKPDPVVSAFRRNTSGESDETAPQPRKILWSNANVNENFPEPITPLLYSVASAGYYHYFLNLGRAFGLSRRRLAAI